MSEETHTMYGLLTDAREAIRNVIEGRAPSVDEARELCGRITRKLAVLDGDNSDATTAAPAAVAEVPNAAAPKVDALTVDDAVTQHAMAWYSEGHVAALLDDTGLANPKGDRATERLYEAIDAGMHAASSGAYERGYGAGFKAGVGVRRRSTDIQCGVQELTERLTSAEARAAAADKNCRLLRQRLEVVTAEHERLREKYHALWDQKQTPDDREVAK